MLFCCVPAIHIANGESILVALVGSRLYMHTRRIDERGVKTCGLNFGLQTACNHTSLVCDRSVKSRKIKQSVYPLCLVLGNRSNIEV